MAHSSWKVFSSFTTSRTDDHDEVLFMLDEIPTDNKSTTEEEPDSEPHNTALETDLEEPEDSSPEPSDGEPHETPARDHLQASKRYNVTILEIYLVLCSKLWHVYDCIHANIISLAVFHRLQLALIVTCT